MKLKLNPVRAVFTYFVFPDCQIEGKFEFNQNQSPNKYNVSFFENKNIF